MSGAHGRARLAIHGGAGVIEPGCLSAELEARYLAELRRIVGAVWQTLVDGCDAVSAAEQAVCLLEDCELFNAGRGAVLNRDAEVEMDAAIMAGHDRSCGAVAAATGSRNPVSLARAIMQQGEHVLLAGAGAEAFARRHSLPIEPLEYFVTEDRMAQLRAAAAEGRVSLDHDQKIGTVGAVARDQVGDLAAATSTGGMTNKQVGRVGDSPIIGAGTWADNTTCAVSGTGHGEFFIRSVVAYDVHARMCYAGQDLVGAADAALEKVAELGGSGGLIAIDAEGEVALRFNASGMYRGWVAADGRVQVAIY